MKQEDKELLLKDLCARLPYGVNGKMETTDSNGNEIKDDGMLNSIFINEYGKVYICIEGMEYELDYFKPYLRPMSSMTEDERIEFINLFDKWHDDELFDYIEEGTEFSIWKHKGISPVVFDWLNAHNFDYRGLVPMGLALEAPE